MFRNISGWISQLSQDPVNTLIEIVFMIAALLLSLILHEIGHGFVALKCGDPTAKMMGRLTLDPRKHLDPIGAICMFFIGIGWAKPVPVNPYNFRNRSRDTVLVSFAGIGVNLILFLLSGLLLTLTMKAEGLAEVYKSLYEQGFSSLYSYSGQSPVIKYLQLFLWLMLNFNLSLAVFNLIPVPPLDGFRLVNQIIFKGELNLSLQAMQIIHFAFLFICLSGLLSTAFGKVLDFCVRHAMLLFLGIFA